MKKICWLFCIVINMGIVPCVAQQVNIPKVEQRVSDFTNTLSYQEWNSLEQMLKSFEDSTSTQIVVLMVNSLEGQDISDYANKVFEMNKIGQGKKNNGVLLCIAKQDRKLKIEVGYGLEGVLTDAVSSQIIRQEITPHFKSSNYFGGIATGTDAIMRAVAGEYHADTKGKDAPKVSVGLIILAVISFFLLMPLLSSRRRSIIGSSGGRYYSGWGYGGGSSFGGFGGGGGFGSGGGFSGGGGMSGGGGASGSW